MNKFGSLLDTEIHTTFGSADVYVFDFRSFREVLNDSGAIEHRLNVKTLVEIIGHITQYDMNAFSEQVLECIGKVII